MNQNKYGFLLFFISIIIIGVTLFTIGVIFNITLLSEGGVVAFSLGFIEALNEGLRTKEKNLQNKSKEMGLVHIGFEDNNYLKTKLKEGKFSIYLIGINLNSILENLDEDFKEIIMKNKNRNQFVLRFYITKRYNQAFRHEQENKNLKDLYRNAKVKFTQLKTYATDNNFQGEISLFEYNDIPYCSLILIDQRCAIWTPYLYTLPSQQNIRFVFKDVTSEDNQFKYFEKHYELLSKIEENWTNLVDSNKTLEEIKNAL